MFTGAGPGIGLATPTLPVFGFRVVV
jgi:hypothetical protein